MLSIELDSQLGVVLLLLLLRLKLLLVLHMGVDQSLIQIEHQSVLLCCLWQ